MLTKHRITAKLAALIVCGLLGISACFAQAPGDAPAAPHPHIIRYVIIAVIVVAGIYLLTRKKTVRPDTDPTTPPTES
jgi:hypothetical protein